MEMVVLTTITVSSRSSGSSILAQKITAVRRTAMFTCILLWLARHRSSRRNRPQSTNTLRESMCQSTRSPDNSGKRKVKARRPR